MTLERDVEQAFKAAVAAAGGTTEKMPCPPHRAGFPDRLVALNGHVYLVELKKPGGRLRVAQARLHKEFAGAGITVHIINNAEEAEQWVKSRK